MSLLELLLLLFFMVIVVVVVMISVVLIACRGKRYVGPTNVLRNGVLHVMIDQIDCDSFTVGFGTEQAIMEVSGSIDLSPWSDPVNGVQISTGPPIAQTITATYASAQTAHHLRFSNGSYGLQRNSLYKFSVNGRGRADDESSFFCKTSPCCWQKAIERGVSVIKETTSWKGRP
jgi:hypothetical protein